MNGKTKGREREAREKKSKQPENMKERSESQGSIRAGYVCVYVLARQSRARKAHQWSITQSAIHHQNEPAPPKMDQPWSHQHPE